MRGNSVQANSREDRQREHERQQERLKAMAATSDKPQVVSADAMIENLLKNSFKKLPQTASFVNPLNRSSNVVLPLWLQCESDTVPDQYKHLWSLVQSTLNLADTQKVSQLLLTSGLQVDILGFIWNLVNKTIPGQLTKQEFFIVLALVSLAQTGHSFSDLSVLKLLTVPSIPVLQVDMQKNQMTQPYESKNLKRVNIDTSEEFPNSSLESNLSLDLSENEKTNYSTRSALDEIVLVNNLKSSSVNPKESNEANLTLKICSNKTQNQYLGKQINEFLENSNFPCIGSSPMAELGDDFSAFQSVPAEKNESYKNNQSVCDAGDDFTEFQSANVEPLDPFETVVINQKKEISKISLPKTFNGKFINFKSNILKISPETEKKLKVLSPKESLSSLPESKISSNNKVSTSISVLGSNHGIGSRLANHSFNNKQDRSKCHKHHKIKINSVLPAYSSAEDDIIFGVKTRSLESIIPKCCPKHSNSNKSIILKETKIKSDEISESSMTEQTKNEPNHSVVHAGENTRQIEIPMLGTFNETTLPTQSKLAFSFDLITVQEDKYSALREIKIEPSSEQYSGIKEVNDDFGDFLSADIPDPAAHDSSLILNQIINSNPDLNLPLDSEKSDWGDWNFNTETTSTSISNENTIQNSIIKASNNKAGIDLFDSFTSLTLNEKCNNQLDQSDLHLSEQLNYFTIDTKMEKADDLSAQPKSDLIFNAQSEKEFWEFLSTDIKPAIDGDFSRHSSLPSLDLKIFLTDESEHETVWRKCLDSCYSLIQEGYEIFNNINIKSVLDQVFTASKTEDYLNYLNIVFQISKRVSQNFNIIPSTQEDLEKLWGRLQDLCFEYNIKLKHNEDNCSEGKVRCKICLRRIGYNVINQGTGTYHPTCANLWINCVDAILPFSV